MLRRSCSLVLLLTAVIWANSPASISVEQNGSGDYTTIIEAVVNSTDGDTILVGPGEYHEHIETHHQLAIISTGGPTVTVWHGDDTRQIARFEGAATAGSLVEGFRVTHGYNPYGGIITFRLSATGTIRNCEFDHNTYASVLSYQSAVVDIEGCTFTDNYSPIEGASIIASLASINVSDCEFVGNHSDVAGGGISIHDGGDASVTSCTFRDNEALVYGGAIHCGSGGTLHVESSVFVANRGGNGSAIYYFNALGTVTSSTFHGNIQTGSNHATLLVHASAVQVDRNIITFEAGGPGLEFLETDPFFVGHSCNLFYGNNGGALAGDALAADDRVEWPMYCDMNAGDLTVSSAGPAVATNSACGAHIGALPAGCSEVIPAPGPPPPPPPPGSPPVIVSIEDVPNDQGRAVRIKWTRSEMDDASANPYVTGYSIYRFEGMITMPAVARLMAARRSGMKSGATIDGWDYLLTVPARGDEVYQTVATTTCDSTKRDGMCLSAFFISAETEYPTVFWDSDPDSGYSVDNLPPAPPANLVSTYADGRATLSWDASRDPDLAAYHVYRGMSGELSDPVATVSGEPTWEDPVVGRFDYRVTAVDDAGNESDPAGLKALHASRTEGDRLRQNAPNPFNPSTTIPLDVMHAGRVTLRVYDAGGRLVRTLLDREMSSGTYDIPWDGTDDSGQRVSSGIYFCRMTTTGFAGTRKMALIQ